MRSPPMVGMAAQDGESPVDLFGQHGAHQKMRPDLRPEGEAARGFDRGSGIEAVRSADKEDEIARAGIAHRSQHFGERIACHAFAAGIEKDHMGARRNAGREPFAFLGDARFRLAEFGDRDFLDGDRTKSYPFTKGFRATDEILAQRAFRGSARVTDRKNVKPHGRLVLTRRRAFGFFDRPHAFEIVIIAYFRTEHVHDDVARIHERPIALSSPVRRPRSVAGFLQAARQMFGDGAHMASRPAARDDERVRQRRPPFEVDRHDVFGFVVVERSQDAGEERQFFGRGALDCALLGGLAGQVRFLLYKLRRRTRALAVM